ncbi:hypothetical protein DUZ99_03490 [Xylanibacillus composti]|uniref:DUF4386 family protein n=1 Tax=Xylanibacillus composti TaxID=1572762 RepID=A0A8J4M2Z8_9BACL|nr:hypothetical protein [Xylanibacillus composti]MDT9724064.1 hypothetical protein [Xylanibacillus composti]GIQ69457.1 hypothetical protein XYCOK13_22810 [Xylanibacillus composti]
MNTIRWTAAAWMAAGIMFVLYPATRPFSDEVSLEGAAAFASGAWIVSHMLAVLAFLFTVLGLLGFYMASRGTKQEGAAFRIVLCFWIGTGLLLPYYGMEMFGLYALGQEALSQQSDALISLANEMRFGPGIVPFLLGFVLLAVGAVYVSVVLWRSRRGLSKWGGLMFALGLILYLPQFFGNQPIRVAHGALVAVGCLWLALDLWRHSSVSRMAAERRQQPLTS